MSTENINDLDIIDEKCLRYDVEENFVGERIDRFVSEKEDISRALAVKLIEGGLITVGEKPTVKNYKLRKGDTVEITYPEPEADEAMPENIPLAVVYEDKDIIVINKPKGMVVHPAAGNYTGTLVNALLFRCRDTLSGIGGVLRPGIVHRIDKDTTGLLVVAKNDAAHRALAGELKHHGIEREYHALVQGGFNTQSGTVDLPIGRHPTDRKKMAVLKNSESARDAVTHYAVVRDFGNITYLKIHLETGRTHQIRVHMSHLGHPLLGDTVYGGGGTAFEKRHASLLKGQSLHAKRLSFTHPTSGERMSFECPLPEEFTRLCEILEPNEQ